MIVLITALLLLLGTATLTAELLAPVIAPVIELSFYVLAGALYLVFALIACGIGWTSDRIYDHKVARGRKPFRLPFYYRWKGWRLGGPRFDRAPHWKQGGFYDRRHNRIVLMYRPL